MNKIYLNISYLIICLLLTSRNFKAGLFILFYFFLELSESSVLKIPLCLIFKRENWILKLVHNLFFFLITQSKGTIFGFQPVYICVHITNTEKMSFLMWFHQF